MNLLILDFLEGAAVHNKDPIWLLEHVVDKDEVVTIEYPKTPCIDSTRETKMQ